MTETKIDELVRRATVRLGPADGSGVQWGSGFFVTPEWVLSCAHVLDKHPRGNDAGPVSVTGGRMGAQRARPVYWIAGGTDLEYDLVLLRMLDGARSRYCVRLTDRIDKPHRVAVHGWYVPRKDASPREWSGRCQVNGTDGPYGLTLGFETEIPHGASGGPVLDLDRGVVVGVVKARRKDKDGGLAIATSALRGFDSAVPVGEAGDPVSDPYRELIRAHDQWHQEQLDCSSSWVAAQEELGSRGERQWTPRDSATASALLATLPPPSSTDVLIAVIGQVLGEKDPMWPGSVSPRDWRDGHGWLYESAKGDDFAFLRYLTLVAKLTARTHQGEAKKLDRWARSRAQRLPAPYQRTLNETRPPILMRPAGVDGGGPVVAVELLPDAYRPDCFHWRIWTWRNGTEPPKPGRVSDATEGVPLAQLPWALNEPLNQAFGDLDDEERPARLEVVLPVEYFDLDVHLWRPVAVRSSRPHPADRLFGVHRQVVLRCPQRREETKRQWEARWRAAMENGLQAFPLTPFPYDGDELAEAPGGSVPILCRTAAESTGTLQEMIGTGYPLALWSSEPQHVGNCSKDCDELRERAAKLLQSAGVTDLPEELRLLRERIGQEDLDAYWAAPLALMYDDPRRPVPARVHPVNSP